VIYASRDKSAIVAILVPHVQRIKQVSFLMYGGLSACLAMAMYLTGVLMVVPRYLLGLEALLRPASEWLVWYSGVPLVTGIVLALVDSCCSVRSAARPNYVTTLSETGT
jgi:hypothetical protein